ncbi:MAG: sulfotransferase family protein [Verrucomicrobiota bacterium]
MKIFEIGWAKTGTTSLGRAYEILGYRHMGWNSEAHNQFIQTGDYEPLFEIIDDYDAFEDGPWHNCDYRVLDQRYPGSRFILLERDNESWVRSMELHYSPDYNVNQIDALYLEPGWITNRSKEINRLIRLKEEKYDGIREYFAERAEDLLEFRVVEGWAPLCEFLDQPIPDEPFPKLNVSVIEEES